MEGLFREYLTNLRASKLQLSHSLLLGPLNNVNQAVLLAHEAELVTRIREAHDVYEKSTERFVKEYLK